MLPPVCRAADRDDRAKSSLVREYEHGRALADGESEAVLCVDVPGEVPPSGHRQQSESRSRLPPGECNSILLVLAVFK